MEINQETIRALLDAFEQSDWREMTVTFGSDRLHVSRDAVAGASTAPPPRPPDGAAATPAPAASVPETATEPGSGTPDPPVVAPPPVVPDGIVVESPSVGLFWRAPSPTSPPFVEVGGVVSSGDTLAIVEVMKLMNHVVAPVGGTVRAILPANGEAVEYGQALVVIESEG